MRTSEILVISGGTASLLVLILFSVGWIISVHRKHSGKNSDAWEILRRNRKGTVLNAAGYGLLPAAAVLKTFEHYSAMGKGTNLVVPLPEVPFLTSEGCFAPCRIEMVLLLVCFVGLSIWLMLRADSWPENGDLLLVSIVIWSGIRMLTESMRAETFTAPGGIRIVRCAACAALVICMILWTVRSVRKGRRNLWICWIIAVIAVAALLLTAEGILSVHSDIGDLSVIAACAAAAAFSALHLHTAASEGNT